MKPLVWVPKVRTSWLNYPPALLVASGALVGAGFPMAKVASSVGISPLVWVLLHALGVMLSLGPVLWYQQRIEWPTRKEWRYAMFAGPVTFAVPNLIAFLVIPHTGAGYTGIMYALSPVFTLVLALLWRMQVVNRWGLAGIVLGLAGALLVSLGRGVTLGDVDSQWLFGAALIPLFLAGGNVFRTRAWPEGASPDRLAFWSNGAALICYLVLALGVAGEHAWLSLLGAPGLVAGQLLLSGLTAPVLFRLQQQGGPVMLSQIGYVAAATSLGAATVLLGEQYSNTTWQGAALIAAGVAATVYANRRA